MKNNNHIKTLFLYLRNEKNFIQYSDDQYSIKCIFCNDHSSHLSINLKLNAFHCWRCDTSGNLHELLKYLKSKPAHKLVIVSTKEEKKEIKQKIKENRSSVEEYYLNIFEEKEKHKKYNVLTEFFQNKGFSPQEAKDLTQFFKEEFPLEVTPVELSSLHKYILIHDLSSLRQIRKLYGKPKYRTISAVPLENIINPFNSSNILIVEGFFDKAFLIYYDKKVESILSRLSIDRIVVAFGSVNILRTAINYLTNPDLNIERIYMLYDRDQYKKLFIFLERHKKQINKYRNNLYLLLFKNEVNDFEEIVKHKQKANIKILRLNNLFFSKLKMVKLLK